MDSEPSQRLRAEIIGVLAAESSTLHHSAMRLRHEQGRRASEFTSQVEQRITSLVDQLDREGYPQLAGQLRELPLRSGDETTNPVDAAADATAALAAQLEIWHTDADTHLVREPS